MALVISVMYRGNAIPIAWRIIPANREGAWNPHWVALLDQLKGVIAEPMLVIVLSDRGLWSPVLFKAIKADRPSATVGFHPFMRIKQRKELPQRVCFALKRAGVGIVSRRL